MKTRNKHRILSILTMLAIGLFFIGCSKLAPMADVTVRVNLPFDINVTIPPAAGIMSTSGSYAFNDSATIDPTTDTLVTKYESYVKSWTVDSITAIFSDVSSPVTLSNVSFEIKPESGNSFGWQFSSLSVDSGTNLVLDNANGQLDELGTVLNGTQPFKVYFSGTSNLDNVHFTLSVKLNTTLVANPLGSV